MIKLFLLLTLLATPAVHGNECSGDDKIQQLISPCQISYYKYAPKCKVGDSVCLSLILQGLVSKDLFNYRDDLRRVHNTPLKQKTYKRTPEYRAQYQAMLEDLEEAKNFTFCAEMNTYWLYDIDTQGFHFPPNTLIPRGKLYRLNNIPRLLRYDFFRVGERDAIDIEGWETLANSKFVFFRMSPTQGNYVRVNLMKFVWFNPSINFNPKGSMDISHEEGCQSPSYFMFEILK